MLTICKKDSQWKFAVRFKELKLGLCNNLEQWDGDGGEREIQKGGDTCILIADSHCCTTETNAAL